MSQIKIDLSLPEAALAISVLTACADDDPSESEAVVLRKYYRPQTAESLVNKMVKAGLKYPMDIKTVEAQVFDLLKKADAVFKLRTLAVALKLAYADSHFDRSEMLFLNSACAALGCTLHEAKVFGEQFLSEASSEDDYYPKVKISDLPANLDLTQDEAGTALCAFLAFADDDPSDAEVAVVREYFGQDPAVRLIAKMKEAGLKYPDDLARLQDAIGKTLSVLGRDAQIKTLALAWKTAQADGKLEPREEKILTALCDRFYIGRAELEFYFKAYA